MASIEKDLTLLAWRLKDNNGFAIADQTSEPITGTFGDFVRLELDYQTASLGVGESLQRIQSNFGLFVAESCMYPYAGQSLSVGWQYIVNSGTVLSTQYEMCLIPENISPTQYNQQAYFTQTSADEFTVALEFYFGADLNSFITTEELDNSKRLLFSLMSSDNILVNEPTSVYSIEKATGTYTYVESVDSSGAALNTFWRADNLRTQLAFLNE